MPCGETHRCVGLASGVGYAAFQAKEQSSLGLAAEVAGGALGGYWGGKLPDVFEPAIHSWHRSLAHSGWITWVAINTMFRESRFFRR